MALPDDEPAEKDDDVEILVDAGWLSKESLEPTDVALKRAGERSELNARFQAVLKRRRPEDVVNVEAMLDRSSAARQAASEGWGRKDDEISAQLVEAGLIPALRSYQIAAVEFLVQREKKETDVISPLEDGWERVGEVWWHRVTGSLARQLEPRLVPAAKGGVLADEMGLGKTLVAIAVILLRPKPVLGPQEVHFASAKASNRRGHALACLCGDAKFRKSRVDCPRCGRPHHADCWAADWTVCPGCDVELCETDPQHRANRKGGTLIVCPPSIVKQWTTEIQRRCTPGTLSVHRYRGVGYSTGHGQTHTTDEGTTQSSKCQRLCELAPTTLSGFDVVLTTYDTLRTDCNHTRTNLGSKYAIIGSPLTAMTWHRVVVDEAQLCESAVSAATKFVRRVDADHRWAVTGTPVRRLETGDDVKSQKKIDDLTSLFVFLQAQPWIVPRRRPLASQLQAAIARLVWRATKETVGPELLGIPPATTEERRLDFSDVERVFYDETKRDVKKSVASKLAKLGHRRKKSPDDMKNFDESALKDDAKTEDDVVDAAAIEVVAPGLLKLRQACCHPSAVGGSLITMKRFPRKKKRSRRSVDDATVREDTSTSKKPPPFHTLDEVLTQLCLNARLEFENKHRDAVFWRCALAALVDAKGQLEVETREGSQTRCRRDAIALYESVLTDLDASRGCVEIIGDVTLEGSAGTTYYRRGKWAPISSKWTKIDVGEGKRLVAIACRSSRAVTVDLEVAIPVIGATVPLFQSVRPPFTVSPDAVIVAPMNDNDEAYAHPRGRQWRIKVDNDDPEFEIRLFECETDTDANQELHAAYNLDRIAGLAATDPPPEEDNDVSMTPAEEEEIPWIPFVLHERKAGDVSVRVTRTLDVQMIPVKAVHDRGRLAVQEAGRDAEGTTEWWRDMEWDWSGFERSWRSTLDQLGIESDPRVAPWLEAQSVYDLRRLVDSSVSESTKLRMACLGKLNAMTTDPSAKEQAENHNCRFCRVDTHGTGKKCQHCVLSDHLERYEGSLFFFKNQEKKGEGRVGGIEAEAPQWKSGKLAGAFLVKNTNSLRRSGLAFYALETLLAYLRRQQGRYQDVIARGQRDLAARRARELEFNQMRIFWKAHYDLLSELDSVRMAKMAVTLAEDQAHLTSLPPEIRNAHVLPSHLAVDARIREAVNDLAVALTERRNLRSKFKHLLHRVHANAQADDDDSSEAASSGDDLATRVTALFSDGTLTETTTLPTTAITTATTGAPPRKKDDAAMEDGPEDGRCAVCLQTMTVERGVLSFCGHEFCGQCVRDAAAASGGSGLKCPTCRRWHQLGEVCFTLALKSAASKDVRTFGTKVSALVADVAAVPHGEKVLVFAEWEAMLEVVVAALAAAGVPFERPTAKSGTAWDHTLERFRTSADVKALVLNVRAAGAGLTLVEANHVFLLHPLLSRADEAQAIGRVHRIGQSRPVVVKRFLINNTVEINLLANAHRSSLSPDDPPPENAPPHTPRGGPGDDDPESKRRRTTPPTTTTGSYVNRAAAQAVRSRDDLRCIFDLTGDDLRQAEAELYEDSFL